MLAILKKRLSLKRTAEEEIEKLSNSQIKSLLKEMALEVRTSRPSIEEVADRWKKLLQDKPDSSVHLNQGFFRRDHDRILNASGLSISELPLVLASSLEWVYLDSNLFTRVPSFQSLPRLRGLSLAKNYLAKIENLHSLGSLEELYLSDNRIERIENLEGNGKLRVVILRGNLIGRVEGVEHLKGLEVMDLRRHWRM